MDPHSPVIAQRFDAGTVDGRLVVLVRARQPGKNRYFVWCGGQLGEITREDESALRHALAADRNPAMTQQLRAACNAAHVQWSGSLVFEGDGKYFTLTREGSLKRIEPPKERAALDDATAQGTTLAARLLEGRVETQRMRVARALKGALERLNRRLKAVRGDLQNMDKAIDEAHRAQMFVAEAAKAPRGTTQLTTYDWETGAPISLAIAANIAPREALERIFRRKKRLKEGRKLADERISATELTIQSLTECINAIAEASTPEAIDTIVTGARKAAPREFRLGETDRRKSAAQTKALPCRLFQAARDRPIWVGRNAIGNDALLQIAQPHDVWLHAKDQAGSHVIVPLARGEHCPPDVLVEAAHLAAHFSDARQEAVVDVQHTTKRYLRKPKGAAPGFVVVTQEKVLVLRIEPLRLKALLDTERATEDLSAPPRQ